MSLFATVGPPWNIALSISTMVLACALVFDANWMAAIIRHGLQSARPPVFKSPIPIEGLWLRVGYLALAVFCIAPMMMQPAMGITRLMTSPLAVMVVTALVACVALIVLAETRRLPRLAGFAAAMVAVLLIAPYALTGTTGWMRYLVVVGMLTAILSLLFLSVLVGKWLFAYRPRSRGGAWLRLILDGILAVAVMAMTFWP